MQIILLFFNYKQRESLAKFGYDMSKLLFAGAVIEGWIKDNPNIIRSYSAFVVGIFFFVAAIILEEFEDLKGENNEPT
jgi:hypothetical protein